MGPRRVRWGWVGSGGVGWGLVSHVSALRMKVGRHPAGLRPSADDVNEHERERREARLLGPVICYGPLLMIRAIIIIIIIVITIDDNTINKGMNYLSENLFCVLYIYIYI